MPAEGFFQRWSRLKTEPVPAGTVADDRPPGAQREVAPVPDNRPAQPEPQADGQQPAVRPPTLDDVAQLRPDSDYSAFVARGVDTSVRRGALKKLFADPHFNIGDGLDLYMGDYNKPDPIPAAMMSALRHTQSFFAQAYPDQKADEEDKDSQGVDTGTLAAVDQAAGAPAPCIPEPSTPVTAAAAATTAATRTITEDQA
ncbi:DUF3306 domain-containing protein [Massilia sp. GCM10020059]|uniref:DUF3306 domain-containing protein n=1 Tax=Massilia agrisoli TaxID=2892444 RepID=A0ABS8IM25_9BURK|nr:DUF3306 domain-containing protein [Massilia agrisoli]MCC6069547.1 DUF3306 domain-containing protein [Massilia agrisoli]